MKLKIIKLNEGKPEIKEYKPTIKKDDNIIKIKKSISVKKPSMKKPTIKKPTMKKKVEELETSSEEPFVYTDNNNKKIYESLLKNIF